MCFCAFLFFSHNLLGLQKEVEVKVYVLPSYLSPKSEGLPSKAPSVVPGACWVLNTLM